MAVGYLSEDESIEYVSRLPFVTSSPFNCITSVLIQSLYEDSPGTYGLWTHWKVAISTPSD